MTGHPPAGIFDFEHNETNNTVCTVFEIDPTLGTGSLAGVTGTGELCYTYDTLEPHNLLNAHIHLDALSK